jgi:hypothetical protein
MRDENNEIGRSIGAKNVSRCRLMARHDFQKPQRAIFVGVARPHSQQERMPNTSHTALKEAIAPIALANVRHDTATSIGKDRMDHHGVVVRP